MTCSICRHADRAEIDRAIMEGEPRRAIASRKGIGQASVQRHKAHVEAKVVKAAEKVAARVEAKVDAVVEAHVLREASAGPGLIERLFALTRETREILAEARLAKDRDVAIKALTRLEKQLELEAKILGQIREAQVNVAIVDPVGILRAATLAAEERRRFLP